MERGVSPTPSSCHSSQDLGRPPRSTASYRLFPIVEPNRPASPITLPKANLSKAGGYRRRSSSVEHASKDSTSSASSVGAPTPPSTLRDARKVSVPDVRPLTTVEEFDHALGKAPTPPLGTAAAEGRYEHSRIRPSPTQGGSSTLRTADRAPMGNARHDSPRRGAPADDRTSRTNPGGASTLPTQTGSDSVLRQKRSKPNLRIKVVDRVGAATPPPQLPTKDLADARGSSDPRAQHSPAGRSGRDTAYSGNLQRSPTTSQHRSFAPSEANVNANDRVGAAGKGSERAGRRLWPKVFSREGLPPLASHAGRVEAGFSGFQARPSTAGAVGRMSHIPSEPLPKNLADMAAMYRSPIATRPEEESLATDVRGLLRSSKSMGQLKGHQQLSSAEHTDPLPLGPFPARISSAAYRAQAGNHAQVPKPYAHDKSEDATSSPVLPARASTALAIARANVAALNQANATSDPAPAPIQASQPPASEHGSSSHAFTPASQSRSAAGIGGADPLTLLRDMAQQCETLHKRYASLRAERQKLSSGLIDMMQQRNTTSEAINALVDEQLSLAAVSSSMDICVAKLKSLECRREDAIAALIAQTTEVRRSPSENISAIIASMSPPSRKSSISCSTDRDSRYGDSSRSTLDLRDSHVHDRSTQSTLPTSASSSGDRASTEYRLSLTSSLKFDPTLQLDFLAPETIPEVIESPPRSDASQARNLLTVQTKQPDEDVMILSPARYTRPNSPPRSTEKDAEHQAKSEGESDDTDQPSDDSDMQDDDESQRISRMPGSKAAKFLGLLNSDGQCAPQIALPPQLAHLAGAKQNSQLHLQTHLETGAGGRLSASPLQRMMDYVDSPTIKDLGLHLRQIPEPNATEKQVRPKPRKELPFNPLAANPPTPKRTTFSQTFEDPKEDVPAFQPPPRRDSAMPPGGKIVKRTTTQNSTRTTHTIQVYLGEDDDELFDLYRQGSEDRIAAAAEPLHVP